AGVEIPKPGEAACPTRRVRAADGMGGRARQDGDAPAETVTGSGVGQCCRAKDVGADEITLHQVARGCLDDDASIGVRCDDVAGAGELARRAIHGAGAAIRLADAPLKRSTPSTFPRGAVPVTSVPR